MKLTSPVCRCARRDSSQFPHGTYVTCRVLKPIPGQSIVDVSLRPSRIEGDLDDDEPPAVGDTVPGYVIRTNKSGCFIRTSRQIEGRVSIKELCDGFLPDPAASFPPGRLVVGKVKEVHEAQKKKGKPNSPARVLVDLDMRESTLLNPDKLSFDAIELNSKHRGTVTRVEPYGIFVRIENSDVSGLVHKSECSDKFIKNLDGLFDPGDLVKVLVIKSEAEGKKLGLSMKPSHFADDDDSDDDSSVENSMEEDADQDLMDSNDEGSLDSDDENFGAKLAAKMQQEEGSDDSSDDDSGSSSVPALDKTAHESSESDDESDHDTLKKSTPKAFDMDVGFDWGPTAHPASSKAKDEDDTSQDGDSSSESEEEEDDNGVKSSHKSRKQQARRRREEQEIAHRETALADGTADQNPETAADFERLIAGNPNASEIWIRYMAWFLSLADIPSARSVANRAFERIEFRQEQEKLNVWTALLTLELKYGDGDSLQACIDRACQQNNPKHVYLRVCELLEKDLESSSSPSALSRADEMFEKMCKKFKSKKQVWIAHMQFLLKHSRQQDAHKLLKRALMSLPAYKHAETMSKFAQSEFEFGSSERARTVFHGILLKYPKRLDLFLVYLDKEIKHGSIETARAELEKKVHPPEGGKVKISDKQMKSLFKKWYGIEEQHGTDKTREHVKNTARAYVNQTST
jgi:rRNA biogenesis protein RRP5